MYYKIYLFRLLIQGIIFENYDMFDGNENVLRKVRIGAISELSCAK